jgi:hypothetical protein
MYRLPLEETRIYLRAQPFEGEMLAPESLLLAEPSLLEFLPLAYGKPEEQARLEVYAIANGKVTPLFIGTPCFLGSEKIQGGEPQALLKETALLDLSPYTGRRIGLKWILHDRGRPLKGAIASIKTVPKESGAHRRPDILFICSDTHRYDFAFGEAGLRLMPNLQEFKKNAVVYHRAFSNASWTMPSIASVLTGLFPRYHHTGFRTGSVDADTFDPEALPPGQFGFKTGNKFSLLTCYPDQLVTMTERLQEKGYITAMVASNPLYMLSGLFADGQDMVVHTGVVEGNTVNESAFRIMENRPEDRPLFLLVHYMDVHQWIPWYLQKNNPDVSPREDREKSLASYEQAVRDTDGFLAALLEKWSESIGFNDSMVVFFSDHGEHLLDPGTDRVGHGNSMDEALLHIPLLIHYPAGLGIEAGGVDAPVSLVDLHATVLDMLDALSDTGAHHGTSLLRLEASGPRLFFADGQLYRTELSSIREGPFKLVIDFYERTTMLIDTSLAFTERGEEGQRSPDARVRERLEKYFTEYFEDAKKKTAGLRSMRKVDPDEALDTMNELGYTR